MAPSDTYISTKLRGCLYVCMYVGRAILQTAAGAFVVAVVIGGVAAKRPTARTTQCEGMPGKSCVHDDDNVKALLAGAGLLCMAVCCFFFFFFLFLQLPKKQETLSSKKAKEYVVNS